MAPSPAKCEVGTPGGQLDRSVKPANDASENEALSPIDDATSWRPSLRRRQ